MTNTDSAPSAWTQPKTAFSILVDIAALATHVVKGQYHYLRTEAVFAHWSFNHRVIVSLRFF